MIVDVTAEEAYEIFFQHVQFEVIGGCNMHCDHCRAWNEPRTTLPLAAIRSILDFVISERDEVLYVTLSGGEPFLRQDLDRVVGLVAEYPVTQVVITTNGSLPTRETLEKVASAGKSADVAVQVSIDSPDAAEHDRFRGHVGAFRGALVTLERAKDVGMRTSVRATIRSGHVDSMRALVALARDAGAIRIGFGSVIPAGRAVGNELGMASWEKRSFLEELTRLRQEFSPSIEVVTEDPLKFALGRKEVWDYGAVDPLCEATFGGCTAGVSTFNVGSGGVIKPCAMLPVPIFELPWQEFR